jgi:serine/threonine-protein kinase
VVQKVPAPNVNQDGIVQSTTPAAGSSVKKGSTVTMQVGSISSITLPNVHGDTVAVAEQKLSNAGFIPAGTVGVASQLANGRVVSTHPAPGPGFPLHTQVTLYVSNGTVQVPNTIGMTCSQAQSQLATVGLTGNCVNATSDTVPKGEVISSSPAPGKTTAQAGTVNLTVSSGPAPVPVPNVVGMMQPDARTALENVGLGATPIGCLPSDPTIPDGTVVSQDPAPNTQVPPQSTVKIYIARSTQTTPCP